MAARLILVVVAVLGTGPAAPARSTDFARETAGAARVAVERLDLAHGSPAADSALSAPLARLELETGAARTASWRTLGRMRHTPFLPDAGTASVSAGADLDTVMSYVAQVLLPQYDARFGAAASDSLFAPYDSLVHQRHVLALASDQEALRRYEVKYGPGSARLNFLEVVLNHALQGSAAFGPGRFGPGPLEVLAGYSTSYATIGDARLAAVSVLEAGVRWYFFAPGWGEERGWSSYLRPRFASLGVAVAGAEDGPFRLPGGAGHARIGPFLSWGGIKVAYLGGREQRLMISRQLQWIPNLF